MDCKNKNLEHKECSAAGDSEKGFCTEALHGANGQNPVEQGAGEYP